jgi:hypothetical protein
VARSRSGSRESARDRLDRRLRPAVGQAEGDAAEGRVCFKCNTDLLEESVEVSVTRRRIPLLEVEFDLGRMLVVRASEAAKRLLRLARVTVAQDDETTVWDLLGQDAIALDEASGIVLSSALSASRTSSALLAGMRSLRPQLLLD